MNSPSPRRVEIGRRRRGLAPGPGGIAANAVGGQGEGETSLGGVDGRKMNGLYPLILLVSIHIISIDYGWIPLWLDGYHGYMVDYG